MAGEHKVVSVGGVELVLRWCPSGSFTMGSMNGNDNEEPQIQVVIREGFWMGETEVTHDLWQKAGLRFAMPTEAQWEYACRATTTGDYGGTGRLDDMGWYGSNAGNATHPVGQKTPNAWGLFDMHGNVWEWCANVDQGHPDGTLDNAAAMGASGGFRVLRGGSYWSGARYCRSAYRSGDLPDSRRWYLGFRLCAFPAGK